MQPGSIDFEGGDVNLYRYVANNPVAYRDPYGLFCEEEGAEYKKALDMILAASESLRDATDAYNQAGLAHALAVGMLGAAMPRAAQPCAATLVTAGASSAACLVARATVAATALGEALADAYKKNTKRKFDAASMVLKNSKKALIVAQIKLNDCVTKNVGTKGGCPCK